MRIILCLAIVTGIISSLLYRNDKHESLNQNNIELYNNCTNICRSIETTCMIKYNANSKYNWTMTPLINTSYHINLNFNKMKYYNIPITISHNITCYYYNHRITMQCPFYCQLIQSSDITLIFDYIKNFCIFIILLSYIHDTEW